MTREALKPGTIIEFDGIEAEVLEDSGGDTVRVREDQGLETDWAWAANGRTCVVVSTPNPDERTYEAAVTELTDSIYDSMDFDAFKDVVENGLIGVRQMSNEMLIEEWQTQFGKVLLITDPQFNPYVPPLEERL